MFPTVCRLGPFTLSSYGLLMAVAFLVGAWLAGRATRRAPGLFPMDEETTLDWACWLIVGGIAGGRLLYVAQNWPLYASAPWEILALWHGGLIWYGGFFGGLAASLVFCSRRRIDPLRALDQMMPFGTLGHAIGRIGCFLNGCCLGKPAQGWYAVQFPDQPQPVVAVQLFEAAGLVALYAVLRMAQRPAVLRRPGRIFGGYLLGYAIIRWTVEWWRDQPLVWNGWTLPQLISAVLFVIGLWFVTQPPSASAAPPATTRRRRG